MKTIGYAAESTGASLAPYTFERRMDQINEAFERMERADVRYRFVIDMASLPVSN